MGREAVTGFPFLVTGAIMTNHDELRRLEHKMDTLDAWLRANPTGTPRWVKRQDVWFSTERKYRQVFDAISSEFTPHHEQEEMKL